MKFRFFASGQQRQIGGRAPIIALAVLFLTVAVLYAFPSREEIFDRLERSALAGYETVAETTPRRPSVLSEFYDTPQLPEAEDKTSAEVKETS